MNAIILAILAEMKRRSGVEFKSIIGAKHLRGNDALPRLVWVPTGDRIGPPVTAGGRNPRTLRTRHATMVAHLWGASYGATETLLHHLIASAYDVAHGRLDLGDADWNSEAEFVAHGDLVTISIAVEIPVTDEVAATAKILSADLESVEFTTT